MDERCIHFKEVKEGVYESIETIQEIIKCIRSEDNE